MVDSDFQTGVLSEPPTVSFEFFPPKDDAQTEKLWQTIQSLEPLNPHYVSVTYGAGGSTRDRTHALVCRIRNETSLEPAAHLTCVNADKDEIRRIAEDYWNAGIQHIVALRGDTPDGGPYTPHPEGYAYADNLVKGLKEIGDFTISVAAYPETHPQAICPDSDIEHLKRKFEAGADQAITQYFFDNHAYFSFLEKTKAAHITAPIVPGILPVGSYKQVVRFSGMCGAKVPEWMDARFNDIDDPQIAFALAVSTAAEQCKLLCEAGAKHIHFYTLNRADLVIAICRLLGIMPQKT